ncbi:sigma 54-interacting transcriptional regulator [Clostridium rectalis]|uniref:sigma 54-interacting transcriptional regulator n=1 Tax=Clostridium rectalis TaxID=2040295 RepID=UPI000F630FCA|nr:sigma 54-interacting transcriptional regulator [Clostridium rectalis]
MNIKEGSCTLKSLSFALEGVSDGIIMVDNDDEIVIFNNVAEKILGIKKEEIIGEKLGASITKYDQLKMLNDIKEKGHKVLKIGEKKIKVSFIKKERNICRIEIIFIKDIGKNKKLQEELQKEKNYNNVLKNVLDMAYDGLVVVDEKGYITFISKAYADFLGIDHKQVLGKHVREVIENTRLDSIIKTGKEDDAELQSIRGKYMIANRKPIVINGEIKGAVGKVLFRNISELDSVYKKFNKIRKELEDYKGEIQKLNSANYCFSDIIGNSDEIMETKRLAQKAAATPSNVLLIGESGTGKELFAHSIHKSSNRKYGPFVKVNCAAIPSDLLESELFGYEKGSFTGAKKEGKMGKFELADGGTIFLDEIGDMPLHMQVKLLRVLQEKEVERIGSISPRNIDIRIIAATNQKLEHMVQEGKFRADLYYRLNVVTIKIPPLRDRKEDIVLLSNFLCLKICKRLNKQQCKISKQVMEYFKNYKWKGNIRQLENIIERAINIVEDENILLPKHLPAEITGVRVNVKVKKLEEILREAERSSIINAIEVCNGNKLKAAKLLGISRTTLYEKINKHKIF